MGLRGGPTTGPGKATQIQSNEDKSIKRGDFEARLITARGRTEDEGIVSAFFVGKFYECVDDDGEVRENCPPDDDRNGIPDNHEIDFEFQNSARSVLYLSVWRDRGEYPQMKKRTARIDIAQGIVIENVPDDGSGRPLDELDVQNAYDLGFSDPTFDHSSRFYTYSFEWRKHRVTFYIDLEDGVGRRQLFEVTNELNDEGDVINRHVPDTALRTYANVWHTYANWYPHNFDATELFYKRALHIDYIKAIPSSTSECQTSFAPHSNGAFEAETHCPGGNGEWEWDLERTQRCMFAAFDVVEEGLHSAAGAIHYYGGLFNTGITEGWPVNKKWQYEDDPCSQDSDCFLSSTCDIVEGGHYAEKVCSRLTAVWELDPIKICLPKGFECKSNDDCCKGLECKRPECNNIFCKYKYIFAPKCG